MWRLHDTLFMIGGVWGQFGLEFAMIFRGGGTIMKSLIDDGVELGL